jgi:hypothetical protein
LNGLFIALHVAVLVGVAYYQVVHGGQPLIASMLVVLFSIPYLMTIIAIWRDIKVTATQPA